MLIDKHLSNYLDIPATLPQRNYHPLFYEFLRSVKLRLPFGLNQKNLHTL